MTATPLHELEPFTEHVADWRTDDLQVQAEERIVRNIILSGDVSRNGYRYTADALMQAAELYRDKPVFLDHAANVSKPFERSTRDLVGSVVEARFASGRLRGDIRVLDTEAGRTFLALMESDSPTVGMSHVVLAQRGSDGQLIERIHEVVSVDAVAFPATTRGLRESQADFDRELELLREQLVVANTERDRLQRELEDRIRQSELDALLTASGLPANALTPLFREQLAATDDPELRLQLIRERRQLVQRGEPASVVSRTRRMEADSIHVDFIRAVKGVPSGVLQGLSSRAT